MRIQNFKVFPKFREYFKFHFKKYSTLQNLF